MHIFYSSSREEDIVGQQNWFHFWKSLQMDGQTNIDLMNKTFIKEKPRGQGPKFFS